MAYLLVILGMDKFKLWLEAEKGRATLLKNKFGVTRSFVSNIKSGRRRIPRSWVIELAKISNGELTVEDLIQHKGSPNAKPLK